MTDNGITEMARKCYQLGSIILFVTKKIQQDGDHISGAFKQSWRIASAPVNNRIQWKGLADHSWSAGLALLRR